MVNRKSQMWAAWAWCVAGLFMPAIAPAQSTITLKPVARMEPSAPITLADVADLVGEDAQKLGAVRMDAEPLPVGGDGWGTVDLDRVRGVLRARKDANWGRLTLTGRACSVRRIAPPKPEAAEPAPAVDAPAVQGSTLAPGTVRPLVAAKIAETLGVGIDQLRLTFEEGDKALLDLPMAGRRAEIQPGGFSDRIPMLVTVFDGERIVASASTRVDVRIRKPVLVVRQSMSRGQKIGVEDFTSDTQWLAPKARPANAAAAVGAVAKTPLRAGKVLDETDFEAPIVVRKGDLVNVHCLAGLLKLETIARATQSGRDGEVVTFQTQDSKRTFQARMSGRGRAVTLSEGETSGDHP